MVPGNWPEFENLTELYIKINNKQFSLRNADDFLFLQCNEFPVKISNGIMKNL
jgi:hypothetical protein